MAVQRIGIADKITLDSVKQDTAALISRPGSKVLRTKVFDVPGTFTWTVPNGVSEVYLTGCGAGGAAGDAGVNNGGAGGVTSFGTLLSLVGGGGGVKGAGAGGTGAGAGGAGGNGGANGFGGAGYSGGNAGNFAKGAAGDGGGGRGDSAGGGGGGAGDYKIDYPVTVTPNQKVTVTIGAGGTTVGQGGYGGNGLLIIKWWE